MLCIPPLYHTGAKMHWFGSLITAGKAVLLRGVKPEWILRAVTEIHDPGLPVITGLADGSHLMYIFHTQVNTAGAYGFAEAVVGVVLMMGEVLFPLLL